MDTSCKSMKYILFYSAVLLSICSCVDYSPVASANPVGTWESSDGRFLFLYPDSSLYIKDLSESSVFHHPYSQEKGSWDLKRWKDSTLDLRLHYKTIENNKRSRMNSSYGIFKCLWCSHEMIHPLDVQNGEMPVVIHHVSDTVPSNIEEYMKTQKEKGSGFKCFIY